MNEPILIPTISNDGSGYFLEARMQPLKSSEYINAARQKISPILFRCSAEASIFDAAHTALKQVEELNLLSNSEFRHNPIQLPINLGLTCPVLSKINVDGESSELGLAITLLLSAFKKVKNPPVIIASGCFKSGIPHDAVHAVSKIPEKLDFILQEKAKGTWRDRKVIFLVPVFYKAYTGDDAFYRPLYVNMPTDDLLALTTQPIDKDIELIPIKRLLDVVDILKPSKPIPKSYKILAGLLSLSLLTTSYYLITKPVYKNLVDTVIQGADSAYKIQARPDRPKYRKGENTSMTINSNISGYLTILSIGTSGGLFMIMPYPDGIKPFKMNANEEVHIPQDIWPYSKGPWNIPAKGPAGENRYLILVSSDSDLFTGYKIPVGKSEQTIPKDVIEQFVTDYKNCSTVKNSCPSYGAEVMSIHESD